MKRNILTLFAAAFGIAGLMAAGGQVQAQTVHADYEDGGLYIRLKESAAFAVKSGESRLLNAARFDFLRTEMQAFGIQADVRSMAFAGNDALSRTIAVTIDSVGAIDAFIERLRQCPEVELVEKRPVYYICGQSMKAEDLGDPLSAVIGGINHKWHLDAINADSAWKLATGKPHIKVAVVDNAVWEGHEDLDIAPENLYNVQTREAGSAAPPADVDQTADCPELYNSKCPSYDWSHGTHCAGNVGAVRNNGKGVAAVGSGVTLMGIRCATNSVPGAVSNGFEGVRWAAEHGADVISMSWGSRNQPTATDQELLKSCYERGIILIAAAGNEATSGWFYPAASPYVISVGSVNSDKKYSNEFSNFGKWVDILSPGGFLKRAGQSSQYSVLSTTFCTNQNYRLNGDGTFAGMYYDGIYGTSMATPVAASLCGLLLSVDSTLNTHRMRELLASTAQIISGNERYVRDNSGLIDAFAAVKALMNGRRPMPTGFRYTVQPPKDLEMTWNAPKTAASDPQVAYYRVYRNGNLIKDNLTETAFSDNGLLKGGENYSYSVEAVYSDGTVSLRDGIDFFMPVYFNIEVEIAPDTTWGRVKGAGYYPEGDSVELEAIAAYGYSFVRWNDGDEPVSRQSTYKFAANYDVLLTATFRKWPAANEDLHTAEALTVYPNPTNGTLYVENLPEGAFTGGIYDLHGRKLTPLHVRGGETLSLPVAKLRKGAYIIRLTAADGTVRMAKFQKL